MTYNTGNPIGSADARDLYDNAQNLDKAMNSTDPTWIDRFGVARPTFKGAESELNQKVGDAEAAATQALGYLNTMRATSYGPLADDPTTDPLGNPCTAGDEYFNTTYNLLKRFDGSIWRVPDINTENLASGAGSSMVGHGGQTVEAALNERLPEIGTYALLRAYTGPVTAFFVRGVSNIFDGGFGVFRVDSADTSSADNGGTVIVDANGRRWMRDYAGAANVKWFGAVGNGVTDDTDAIKAAIAAFSGTSASSSRVIYFPTGIYAHTGLSYTLLNHCHLLGESEWASVLKYIGPAGQDAVFFSGYAYSSIRRLGFDGNNLAKRGLVIHDDSGATAGVTIHILVEDIRITDCSDPTGCGLAILPTGDWQISELQFRNIHGQRNYNGIVMAGSQTIMIHMDNVIFYQMLGGVGIEITGGQQNDLRNFFFTGTTTVDFKFVGTVNNMSVNLDGYYREKAVGTVFKFENPTSGLLVGFFDIRNINIAWTGTNADDKIIQQQFGNVFYKNIWIRAAIGSSAGTLDFTHASAGASCYVTMQDLWINGPGAANITKTYGDAFYSDVTAGVLTMRNKNVNTSGKKAISLLRASAFGTQRDNSVAFYTGSTLDGNIGSTEGLTKYFSAFATDGVELMRFGGDSTSGYSVKRVGGSGATGYTHPFYIGDYAMWVDSAGKLRIKSSKPTSDLDGTIVGTQA